MRADAEGWEGRHGYGHSSVNFHNILRSLIMLRSLTLSDSAEKGQHCKNYSGDTEGGKADRE